jgi:hypothetical protein
MEMQQGGQEPKNARHTQHIRKSLIVLNTRTATEIGKVTAMKHRTRGRMFLAPSVPGNDLSQVGAR